MCRPSPFVVPLALAMLAAGATCQSRAVPAHAAVADGHLRVGVFPAAYGLRWQILVDAGAVAPNGATLSGIAFRTDENWSSPAYALTNVSVSLSQTIAPAAGMSTTFASNVVGPVVNVFQGTVNLPGSSTPLVGPGPWDVVIPFTAPYTFTTTQGSLLIDIGKPGLAGGAMQPGGYSLDMVCGGGSGTRVGVAGASLPFPVASSLVCNGVPRALSTGNTLQFVTTLASYVAPPPGVIALGLTAPPAPFDLGVLGAPANFLYIDPQVLVTHAWAQWPTPYPPPVWAGAVNVTVPSDPLLIGTMLYAQSARFDAAANALGIVVGNAVEVRIGDAAEQLPLRMLVGEFGAPSGSFLPCAGPSVPDYGAAALRLDGSFF